MRCFIPLLALASLLVLLSSPPSAHAAESISIESLIQVRAVSWFVEPSGDIKVEANNIGAEVDIEGDLDLEGDTSYGLQLLFRPWASTIFAFAYQPLSFEGSNTIDQPIEFGGETFIVGADVDSELDLKFYDFDFRRSIIQAMDSELSIGLGVSIIDIDASLEGQTAGGVEKESGSATVPLPNLALGGRFQPRAPSMLAVRSGAFTQAAMATSLMQKPL